MNINFKAILKGAVDLATGVGIGVMVKTGAAKLTPESAGKITKVCCKLGSVVIASAIGRMASKEIENIQSDIEEIRDSIQKSMNDEEGDEYVDC